MTVRVERSEELPYPPEQVWAFIADPGNRARAISVVERYELHGDGRATWHVELPIPLIGGTVAVETVETDRDPPNSVEFVGRSTAVEVRGSHELVPTDDGGTLLKNAFVVDGRLPGVETFFKRNLDRELRNLDAALRAELEGEA